MNKKMTPLTDKDIDYHEKQKTCDIYQKRFSYDKKETQKYKLYKKVRDHCHFTGKYRGTAHSIWNLRYKVPYEIPVQFHNGWGYDFHLIIKELPEKFKGEDTECLVENTEKYISSSVSIKKIKNEDTNETATYELKFIDTFRFMRSSLSSLVDNLSEIKDNKCLYKKVINELIKNFSNTYKFSNGDINKFIVLLRKGVYFYEYMDSWDKFDETEWPSKKYFYSKLNLKDISDKDYEHAQNLFKKYCKNMCNYHDL